MYILDTYYVYTVQFIDVSYCTLLQDWYGKLEYIEILFCLLHYR